MVRILNIFSVLVSIPAVYESYCLAFLSFNMCLFPHLRLSSTFGSGQLFLYCSQGFLKYTTLSFELVLKCYHCFTVKFSLAYQRYASVSAEPQIIVLSYFSTHLIKLLLIEIHQSFSIGIERMQLLAWTLSSIAIMSLIKQHVIPPVWHQHWHEWLYINKYFGMLNMCMLILILSMHIGLVVNYILEQGCRSNVYSPSDGLVSHMEWWAKYGEKLITISDLSTSFHLLMMPRCSYSVIH